MVIYINWIYISYMMAVAGGAGGDKVSYAKEEDLKGHPMKGSWRSGEHRNLENWLCLLAFHTAS